MAGFPSNLFDVGEYPYWMEKGGLIGYSRTSPNQAGPQREGEYLVREIEGFARARNLSVKPFSDEGRVGSRIGEKTTPRLMAAIAYARITGFPIVAFEWRRFCRLPHKLARFGDVCFVTLLSKSIDRKLLDGLCRQAANRHNPQGKGGRPHDWESDWKLPFIVSQFAAGVSWRGIAERLGTGWSDKKARRVFDRYFVYRQ